MVAELFADALTKAIGRELSVVDLLVAADKLHNAGQPQFVTSLYRAWIEHNQDSPLLYAVNFNYGVLLGNYNDLPGARAALEQTIKLNPEFLPPWINLGFILERMGATGEAITQWYGLGNKLAGVNYDTLTHKATALKQVGRVLEGVHYDPNAEDALKQSLELSPNQRDVLQHYLSLRQRQCKWPVITPWSHFSREKLAFGMSPLALCAYTDDPLLQLATAAQYCKLDIGWPRKSYKDRHPPRPTQIQPGERRKIGYLSSDLRDHAIGYLTAEIYQVHNRENVEVFAYYCGVPANDPLNARIKSTVDHWIDLTGLSDEAACERILADGIEILVDINGHTHSARTRMIAMHPAPIIVNWLGYPGTLGSSYHHYIIADDFIIPPEYEIFYSEKVLRIPCYQANDRQRIVSPVGDTRQDSKLPENSMVYCCFNGAHKYTKHNWKRWMTILREVPDSVLWLLKGTDGTNERLVELFKQAGLDPQRLIFAEKRRNPDHLARLSLADLFLDTTPYGAHTTSSDALWAGVPGLTLAGRCFSSRVCGSLMTAAGIGDLVCTTSEEYVNRAIEFGRNRDSLKPYRERLQKNRDTNILFNTPLLTSSLEARYAEMWEDYVNDRLPRPNLTNLETYGEIGAELDQDDVEMVTLPNYLDLYAQKLRDRDAFSYLPPDPRLLRKTEGA